MVTKTKDQLISERQVQLAQEFIPKRFSFMVNQELKKIDKNLSFEILDNNWKISTITKTNYFWYSWFEDRKNEVLVCINVYGPIYYNGTQIGPEVNIRYSFKNGFENIRQIADFVMLHKNNCTKTIIPKNFTFAAFEEEDYVSKHLDELMDLITALEEPLKVMGYSPGQAHKTAVEIVEKYPDIKNVDQLLEKVHEG